jgi:hypothetical protein
MNVNNGVTIQVDELSRLHGEIVMMKRMFRKILEIDILSDRDNQAMRDMVRIAEIALGEQTV